MVLVANVMICQIVCRRDEKERVIFVLSFIHSSFT